MSKKEMSLVLKLRELEYNVKFGKPKNFSRKVEVEWWGKALPPENMGWKFWDNLPSPKECTTVHIGCERDWGKRRFLYFVK